MFVILRFFLQKKNLFFDLSVSGNNSKYSFYKFSIPFLFSLKQCRWFVCFVFPKTKQKRRKYSKILIDICLKLHLGRLRLLRIFFDKDKKNVYCTVCVYSVQYVCTVQYVCAVQYVIAKLCPENLFSFSGLSSLYSTVQRKLFDRIRVRILIDILCSKPKFPS